MHTIESSITAANFLAKLSFEQILKKEAPHGLLSEKIRLRVLEMIWWFNLSNKEGAIILDFKRPKPLEEWWWKWWDTTTVWIKNQWWINACRWDIVPTWKWGIVLDKSSQKAIVHWTVIEWWYYYRLYIREIWKIRDELFKQLKKIGYKMTRVNPQKIHSQDYYYRWEIKPLSR